MSGPTAPPAKSSSRDRPYRVVSRHVVSCTAAWCRSEEKFPTRRVTQLGWRRVEEISSDTHGKDRDAGRDPTAKKDSWVRAAT